jgi:hypothetical protein
MFLAEHRKELNNAQDMLTLIKRPKYKKKIVIVKVD